MATNPKKKKAEMLEVLELNEDASDETVTDALLELLLAVKKATPDEPPAPPVEVPPKPAELSQREIAMCREKGVEVARYAATKAAIQARSARGRRP